VGVVALDLDVDPADAEPVALVDVVDQIEAAGLVVVAGLGLNVGEDVADAAVLVLQRGQVVLHVRLVEVLAGPKRHFREELFVGEFRGPLDAHVADREPLALVDHERDRMPFALGVVVHVAADPGPKEPQAAVVGRQPLDILVELVGVEIAAENIQRRRLRLDLGAQAGVAGDRVTHEVDPQHLLLDALVDEEHHARMVGIAALGQFDPGGAVTATVVELFELAAGLFQGERVLGVADLDVNFFFERLLFDLPVAHVADVLDRWPFDQLEHDDPAARGLLGVGLDIDEVAGAV